MRVMCKVRNVFEINELHALTHVSKYINKTDGETDLEVGDIYTVYGVEFRDNHPWYYVCVDEDCEYPKPYSSDFFEVVDNRLSSFWFLSSAVGCGGEFYTSLVIEEWAKDRMFYERLIDGDSEVVEVFKVSKSLMEAEYEF